MDEIQQDAVVQGTSRRTVIKTAAWAAPVVAVAAAAPLAAASVEPPPAVRSQITIDQNTDAGQLALVRVTGRTTEGGVPVDGALPADTYFTLTPSAGATITIAPNGQAGIANIAGPDANGVYTVYPTSGVVAATLFATLDQPGNISVRVFGTAPGGPSEGTFI
ncbi:MAG: hypothetical protein QM713_09330 [Arachnia sp.]